MNISFKITVREHHNLMAIADFDCRSMSAELRHYIKTRAKELGIIQEV